MEQIIINRNRNSSLELVKIFSIILIVISHVVQSLSTNNEYLSLYIDLDHSTSNMNNIILIIFRHFGCIGNLMFFTCSAFFLLGKEKTNIKKMLTIIFDTWLISFSFLLFSLFQTDFKLSGELIIKSIFSIFFANNWYVTCYLVFLFIFPLLNIIIKNISKKTHLFYVIISCFCCFVLNAISNGHLYINQLFSWIIVYFLVSYIKQYTSFFIAKNRTRYVILGIGLVGFVVAIIITNFLGLKISFLNDKTLHWVSNCNPFILMICLSICSIFNGVNFSSKTVNLISSCSLQVYLIHENIIFARIYRPQLLSFFVSLKFFDNIVFLVVAFSVLLFASALLISILYRLSFQRMTRFLAEKSCRALKRLDLSDF